MAGAAGGRQASATVGAVAGTGAVAGSGAHVGDAAGAGAHVGDAATGAAGAGNAATGAAGAGANAGGAATGAGGASGAPGSAGAMAEACVRGDVAASEVVFIGESFIAMTGDIPRMTSDLARKAGTIGMGESYRSFAVSGTQLTTGDIPGQFERAQRESPVKVVLMDGGGNDLLFGDRCKGSFDAACKEVVDVVAQLFSDFAAGGVRDVVYFFYPDPMGIGASIKDAMDILRPEMKTLCDAASVVRCIWVDQRDTWDGHYAEFTSDGIHPTAAGSMASSQQIWDAMVASCVAQ
jgi:lysophospholipase L1-like esterase